MWSIESEWLGLIENACKSLLPNMKRGVSEGKESTAEGREGGRSACGSIREMRRRNDGGERRGGDWIKCLS